jgi:predicted O-methyltransferase YrrM
MNQMRHNEYLERNAKGFEGDNYIALEIKKLVEQFGIELIIETGTYLGNTTKRLAEFAPVYSVELDPANYHKALQNVKGLPVTLSCGDSVDFLQKQLSDLKDNRLLFFLDAHWGQHCPLIDELKAIAEHQVNPVIVIHDFKAPGRSDLGYDTYHGQALEFAWIKDSLEAIYKNNYRYHYNTKTEGARRGVIYIYPATQKT